MATFWILTATLLLFGAALGPVLARWAADRSRHQPIPFNLAAERSVVGAVLVEPRLYPAFALLRSDMFAAHSHGRIWASLQEAVRTESGGDVSADTQAELRTKSKDIPEDVFRNTLAGLGTEDRTLAEELRAKAVVGLDLSAVVDTDNVPKLIQRTFDRLLRFGTDILASSEDREHFQGNAPIRETGDTLRPLVREYVAPSRARVLFTSALTAIGLGLVPFLIAERTPIISGTAQLVAGAAVVAMLVSSVVVALVDWDTLYLDLRTFWVSAGLAWGLTILAQVIDAHPERLLAGLGSILLMLFVIEGVLRLYSKLRGLPMQGGGDTQILLVTAGVPAALSASVLVGLFSGILASAVIAVVVYGAAWALKRFDKDTPFAFGPYLALGWVLGWVVVPYVIDAVYL